MEEQERHNRCLIDISDFSRLIDIDNSNGGG